MPGRRPSGDLVTFRIAIVYVIGFASLAYAFYQIWHDGTANAQALIIGSTCITTAAAIQVALDLWRRLKR
jgi:hypothetical protein